MFNSTEWSVSVEDGDILIFPSSCFHHVKVNQSNNRRISIAFNTFVRGTIGSESAGADLILM
jgi:ectoine hydroxylase-related dioxygenase (phytanoyl-CoA dioxygenase family)